MKKKIPLKLLRVLEPFVNKDRGLFEVRDREQHLFWVIDKDSESDFYFIIEKMDPSKDNDLLVNYKPGSEEVTAEFRNWISSKNFINHFEGWVKILKGYNETVSIYDDPIVNSYSKEFFAEFELVEEDEAEQNLTSKQVLLLDEYLEKTAKGLLKSKTKSNEEEIEEINEDIQTLRKDLTTNSKKTILKRLSKIWGMITKQGAPFLKKFASESQRVLIKEGIKLIVSEGTKLLEQ